MPSVVNREQWLTLVAERVEREVLKPAGFKVPRYRISCSFPSRRAIATTKRCIGQCWIGANRSGVVELLISPTLDSPAEIAETVVHEMLHAALPKGTGHRGPFSRAAKRVGLEGKPTSTYAGDALAERLKAITDAVGPYPHESLDHLGGKKAATYLLKVWCPICHYVIRVTAKWIDSDGLPICPTCEVSMEEAAAGAGEETPLVVREAHTEYDVRGTERFSIRASRRARDVRWYVIDYGDDLLDPGPPRLTSAEGRQDALDLVAALCEGLLTYADLRVDDDVDVPDDFDPDDGDTWGSDEDELERDVEDLCWLGDDEDEEPDNDPDRDLLGNVIDPLDCEREAARRDEAGRATSIAIGVLSWWACAPS